MKDINTQPASLIDTPYISNQRCFTCGNLVYFLAKDSLGNELWKTDGTESGTGRVIDLTPGAADGIYPNASIACFKGEAYFIGKSNIWKTNGTSAGTQLVSNKIISSGLHVFNDKIYYVSFDNQLWSTEGIPGTDKLIKTIDYGAVNGRYVNFRAFTSGISSLYFMIILVNNSGIERTELWKTDGTTAGTVMIKAWPYHSGFAGAFTALGDKLLFTAVDEEHGNELWVSDGTESGTKIVMDINAGTDGSQIFFRTVYKGQIIFHNNYDTWISDGTASGTKVIMPNALAYSSCEFQNSLYLLGPESPGFNTILFKTLGTPETSSKLDVVGGFFHYPNELPVINDKILFPYYNSATGIELGASNGSSGNAAALKDINPGAGESSPRSFTRLNDKIIFLADDGQHGFELWSSDGTTGGTRLVKDVKPGTESANIDKIYSLNGKISFLAGPNANEKKLWTSDGTLTGTSIAYEFVAPHIFGQTNNNLVVLDGSKFWKTNGTPGGTSIMWDFNGIHSSYGYNSNPGISAGDNLFFEFRASNVRDIWRANTSTNQVTRVTTVDPDLRVSIDWFKGAGLGNEMVFGAMDDVHGFELWVTRDNGSKKELLKDIVPGTIGSGPTSFLSAGDKVYFAASDEEHGYELWITDGTMNGTRLVKDINPGTNQGFGYYFGAAVLNDKLIFTAETEIGSELWISDGTEQGTHIIREIDQGISFPGNFTTLDKKVYFVAGEKNSGSELFVTDGTKEGTSLIDIIPGPLGSNPTGIVKAKNAIYFYSDKKIWRTHGTTSTSEMVAKIELLSELAPVGDVVCFVASDKLLGRELFAVDVIKFNQVISLAPIGTKTLGDLPFQISVTSSSGLPVSIDTPKKNIAVSGNEVRLISAGLATVNFTQSGNEDFNAATPLTETFCIRPTKPEITVDLSNSSSPVIKSSSSENNLWYKNDVLLLSTEQELRVVEDGIYTLAVSVDNCVSETATVGKIITEVGNTQSDLSIYPVPSDDFIYASVPYDQGEAKFTLYDIQGRVMQELTSWSGTARFDLSTLHEGMYMIEVKTVKQRFIRLFAKQ